MPLIVLATLAAAVAALGVFTAYDAERIKRSNPPIGQFVEVAGGRIHLVEMGGADNFPIVLLHGASVNLGDIKLALGEQLAQDYRVIAVDRPGHGWSDRPNGAADASPTSQARLVHEALSRIGVSRPILVAHSWSGALATAYALEYPESVAGLVLLAPLLYPWSTNTAAWFDNFLQAVLVQATALGASATTGPVFARTFALPLSKLLMQTSIQSAFAPQLPPADYITRTGGELELRPAEFIANSQDLDWLDEYLAIQARRYDEIQAPVIILTGDRDALAPPHFHAQRLASVLRKGKVVTLPGVGHMIHYAAPEQVHKAIADILGQLQSHQEGMSSRP